MLVVGSKKCEQCGPQENSMKTTRYMGHVLGWTLVASEPRDPRDEGCLCMGCSSRYRVDLMVPDELWPRIRPAQASGPDGGTLCPRCIVNRIEALGEFAAFELRYVGRAE